MPAPDGKITDRAQLWPSAHCDFVGGGKVARPSGAVDQVRCQAVERPSLPSPERNWTGTPDRLPWPFGLRRFSADGIWATWRRAVVGFRCAFVRRRAGA